MSRSLSLLAACLLALPATKVGATGECAGDPGYLLDMPATVGIGANFTTCLEAPGGSVALLLISGSGGPTPTKYGPLCVGFPFLTMWVIYMPQSGVLCLDHMVECDHDVIGVTGHFQFAALGPTPGQIGFSNSQSLTALNSGDCDISSGDFYGYTQGGWGAKCNGQNPGCTRDANFASVFPNGLILGDQDGDDADSSYALVLTTAKKVEDFLPHGGPSGPLTGDEVDLGSSSAGNLAGQLVAAKINVGFDDAGVFDAKKGQPGKKLGDLIYVSGVDSVLFGYSVREILAVADKAISGAELEPYDLDGDLIGDVSLGDLKDAIEVINTNFDNGTVNQGKLALP